MARPVQHESITKNVTDLPQQLAQANSPQPPADAKSGISPLTAMRIEFVAKPQEAHRVEWVIPPAIAGALKDVTGFAGCLVMISDQEARLVTVVTLWNGHDRALRCAQNVRWVRAILAPYLDSCFRVQTMSAHFPVLPPLHFLPAIQPDAIAESECFINRNAVSEHETVCVA